MSRRPLTSLCALAVAAIALALYLPTGAPGLWWGDGPELTAAAYCLGIAHEPGYPLYMMTGHVLIKLFGFMEPIRVMAIYSAVLLAAACGLLVLLIASVIRHDWPGGSPRPRSALIAACGMALLAATAATVWEHATFAEVYPLTFFFAVVLVALAWRADSSASIKHLAAMAFVLGLASTNHYSIIALYPLAGLCILKLIRASAHRVRATAVAFVAWLVPLSTYLYLPIRARANPPLNEGAPTTPARLLTYLTAQRYSKYSQSAPDFKANFARWLEWWGQQWLPFGTSRIVAIGLGAVLIIGAVAGLIRLIKRRPAVGSGLLVSLVATLAFSLFYQIIDIEAYFLVGLPAALIGWVECAAAMARRVRLPRALLFIPACIALACAFVHYPQLDLSNDRAPQAYARAMLSRVSPGGVLIVAGDSAFFPLLYEQIVHHRRPDVAVFSLDLVYAPWHRPYLAGETGSSIPFRIPRRAFADNRIFTGDLINSILLPAYRAGRQVYCVCGPLIPLEELFPRKPLIDLLPPTYTLPPRQAFLMPGSILEEITPNQEMLGMSEQQVSAKLDSLIKRSK